MQSQAEAALAQGREDLAREALRRREALGTELAQLKTQHDQLSEQEQKLEVTGTVMLVRNGAMKPAPGVPLELVAAGSTRVFLRTHSGYDGFYDLSRIPPGRWELRVPHGWLDRARVRAIARVFEVTGERTAFDDLDVMLDASPATAAETQEP